MRSTTFDNSSGAIQLVPNLASTRLECGPCLGGNLLMLATGEGHRSTAKGTAVVERADLRDDVGGAECTSHANDLPGSTGQLLSHRRRRLDRLDGRRRPDGRFDLTDTATRQRPELRGSQVHELAESRQHSLHIRPGHRLEAGGLNESFVFIADQAGPQWDLLGRL